MSENETVFVTQIYIARFTFNRGLCLLLKSLWNNNIDVSCSGLDKLNHTIRNCQCWKNLLWKGTGGENIIPSKTEILRLISNMLYELQELCNS